MVTKAEPMAEAERSGTHQTRRDLETENAELKAEIARLRGDADAASGEIETENANVPIPAQRLGQPKAQMAGDGVSTAAYASDRRFSWRSPEAEERSKTATTTWQVGFCEFNMAEQTVCIDKWAAKVFGFGGHSQTIPYERLAAIMAPSDLKVQDQSVADSLAKDPETEFTISYRIRRPDTGELRWIAATGESVFKDGAPHGMRGTVRDATSEMENHRQLAYERDRLGFIKNAWRLGTWEYMVGESGSIWDARCYEMFGVDEVPLVPLDTFKTCIHPDDVDAFTADVERGMDPVGEGIHAMHFRAYNMKTGRLRWYKTRGRTFFEGNAPVRMLGAIEDVTEDMARQEELEDLNERLRQSEDRLKLATEAGQVGTWDYDPAADLAGFDGVARTLFRVGADHLTQDEFLTRIHPEDAGRFKAEFDQALVAGQGGRLETTTKVHPDLAADDMWLAIHANVIFDGESPVLMTGTIRDVTEATRAAKEIGLMNRELHHRVKNMFSTILGMIRMSARDFPGSQDFAASLSGRIDALSAAHLISMDRENLAPVNLRMIVEAILKPYLANAATRIHISGDDYAIPRRSVSNVGMILHELATNAVKYGALSERGVRLDVELRRPDDQPSTPVTLVWRETCAKAHDADPRAHQGFGSRLIRASARQLGSDYDPVWSESGLIVSFDIPVNPTKKET